MTTLHFNRIYLPTERYVDARCPPDTLNSHEPKTVRPPGPWVGDSHDSQLTLRI